MNKIHLVTTLLSLLWFTFTESNAQSDTDKVLLVAIDDQLVIPHIVSSSSTLYSLSRAFKTDVDDILSFNEGLDASTLSIGDTIYIPLNISQLSVASPSESSKPLYYKVQPKETLFRIARVYLKWREEQLMVINQLTSTDLSIDQELFIGYLSEAKKDEVKMVTTEEFESKEDSVSGKNMVVAFDKLFEEKKEKKATVSQKGVAMWFEDTDVASGMFIMHHHAPLNSIIAITNPMHGKTVHAKVVGHIPEGTYPKEVIAVISPEVAKSLGALDRRFFTQIEYEVQ